MTEDPRRILAIGGDERHDFLQGLVSNDVPTIPETLRYAALLSPQGKYLADFLMFQRDGILYLDVAESLFDGLKQRLSMYRLRRKIALDEVAMTVTRGTGSAPSGAMVDPRHPSLGWRGYGEGYSGDDTDWTALRVTHCIPESGIELIPNDTYILEAGFERLNGVDFRKGCYVGQEVTARMKHKTELKKGLRRVALSAPVDQGTAITGAGKAAGQILTRSGTEAIAFVRADRAVQPLLAGEAEVTLI